MSNDESNNKYSICVKDHIAISDEQDGGICPSCARSAIATTLTQATRKMNLHAYRYAMSGKTDNLRRMERWGDIVKLIEKMEASHAPEQPDNEKY